MILKVFRFILTLCGMLLGYGLSSLLITDVLPKFSIQISTADQLLVISTAVLLFGIIFFYLFSSFRRRGEDMTQKLEVSLEKVPAGEVLSGSAGMVLGLFVAFLISQIINSIHLLQTAYINIVISVIIYIGLGYLGLILGRRISATGLRALLAPAADAVREAAKSKTKIKGASPKIFDTSVIIDGRIYDILKTGFIEGDIIIPEFVLVELRHISDSADGLKRNRGRRGLDILNKIQTDFGVEIYNSSEDKALEEIPEVDVKLIKLAQSMKGQVVTLDYNLNKVATIHGVEVLNINELANTLKPAVLPGEPLQVFVVKEGKDKSQGVGYLDDGTMIVVEDGRRFIGKTADTVVSSVLQTSAGRMIFVKPL